MKRLFLPFMMACTISAAICSCTKEIDTPQPSPEPAPGMERIMLGVSSEDTKTAVNGTTVTWVAGDEIKLFDNDFNQSTGTATKSGESTTFDSEVVAGKNDWYAFYPSSVVGHDDNGFYMTIPAEQDGSFAKSNFSAGVLHRSSASSMSNLTGFIKLVVSGSNYSKITISAVGNEYICGRLNVIFDGNIVSTNNNSIDGSSITLKKSSGNLDATTYYVAVAPACSLSNGLLVQYYVEDEVDKSYYIDKNLTPAKNRFTSVGTLESRCGKFYVSVDGAGSYSGGNWANAMSKDQLKEMLAYVDSPKSAARAAALQGSTIYLAGGTYDFGDLVQIGFNDNVNDYISFTLDGGYTGSGDTKDVENHPTVFSGNDGHCIFSLIHYADLEIIDCNIENSYGNGGGKAAIRLDSQHTKLQLTRCNFSSNTNNYTAGALNIGYGTATLTDCVFSNNTASNAGAINIDNGADGKIDQTGAVTISGCTFSSNSASSGEGGAIRFASGGPLSLTSCTFSNCSNSGTEKNGGAIAVSGATGRPSFTKCKFTNCVSSYRGGAFYSESTYTDESMNFNECEFTGCYAPDEGAAVDIRSSKAVTYNFNDCSFHHNDSPWGALYSNNEKSSTSATINITGGDFSNNSGKTTNDDKWQNGAALYVKDKTTVNVTGVKFEGNVADNGPAIGLVATTAVVNCENCKFLNNEAKTNAGVFYAYANSTKLYCNNSVFDGNQAKEGAIFNIYKSSKSPTLYFNNSVFRNNHWGQTYGSLIPMRSGITGVDIAFNNCTFIRNYINSGVSLSSNYQTTWFNLNSFTGSVLFSNSTIWGRTYQGIDKEGNTSKEQYGFIRVSNSDSKTLKLVNTIVGNSHSSGKAFTINGSPTISAQYCLFSPDANQNGSATWDESGNIHTALARGAYYDGYQTFDGLATADYVTITSLKGDCASFAKQSTESINSAIQSANSSFYTWLNSIGALGKDCRGYTRNSTANWPGAYDNGASK